MRSGRRRFRIIKEIAEGGFGKVYLAEQISSDGFSRIVAVKLLHAKWSSHEEVVMRTRDEARLLGLIRHQHIVKVEDLTSIDGKCAIVMEYLEGVDLKWMNKFLRERGLEFPRTALFEIILGAASALDAGYNGRPLQGGDPLRVIHRDIKPSNVFITVAGGVKVLDFGTARANFSEREAKTQALAFGSQGYMAPERLLGEEDTPAADIFSLGITLYECLTLDSFGRIPPRPSKFAKKVDERVASLPLAGDPEWCDQVRETLHLMMSYEPDERPTASQLVEIMELLAQDAGDMGLRRFCRTLVAEAKANLPDVDNGDPLIGNVVEEDASSPFSPGTSPTSDAGATVPAPPKFDETLEPTHIGKMESPLSTESSPAPLEPPPAPSSVISAPIEQSVPVLPPSKPERSNLPMIAVGLVVAGVLGVGVLGTAGAVAYFSMSDEAVDGVALAETPPDTEQVADKKPEPESPPGSAEGKEPLEAIPPGPKVTFKSMAEGTTKILVVCDDAKDNVEDQDTISLDGEKFGTCTVKVRSKEGRFDATVKNTVAANYTCFAGGEEVCVK